MFFFVAHMILDGIWAEWKTRNCLVDCSMRHIPPLFIGVIVKSLFTVFLLWKIMRDMFWHKKAIHYKILNGFLSGDAWNCCFFCPAPNKSCLEGHSNAEVWTDSWLGSYRTISTQQVRPGAPSEGWDEGVKVSSWSQPVGVVLPGVWWVVDWYQCILDCGLIKGIGFVVATQRHKKKDPSHRLIFHWILVARDFISTRNGNLYKLTNLLFFFFNFYVWSDHFVGKLRLRLVETSLPHRVGQGVMLHSHLPRSSRRKCCKLRRNTVDASPIGRRGHWGPWGQGNQNGDHRVNRGFGGDKVVIGNDMTASG